MHVAFSTTNNYIVIIDEQDYPKVSEKRWYCDQRNRTVHSIEPKKVGVITLNKYLTGNKRTRHYNNNPLDFRRSNLL